MLTAPLHTLFTYWGHKKCLVSVLIIEQGGGERALASQGSKPGEETHVAPLSTATRSRRVGRPLGGRGWGRAPQRK